MEMEIIDTVSAYTVEPGDNIEFDETVCTVKEIIDHDDESGLVTIISEDDRERSEFWFISVDIFGYPSVTI